VGVNISKWRLNIRKIFNTLKGIFRGNIFERLAYARKVCLQIPSLYPLRKFPGIDIDMCVENYIKNMSTAQHYSNLMGARYLHFLQPFNGVGRPQLSKFDVQSLSHMRRGKDFDGHTELDLIVNFYNELWRQIGDKEYVTDLRNIFSDYNGDIYFDQVHCSDIGYDIIAKRIAEDIVKNEQEYTGRKEGARKDKAKSIKLSDRSGDYIDSKHCATSINDHSLSKGYN